MATLLHRYRSSNLAGKLYCGDALDFLRKRKRETADIIFLDPPFNLDKKYPSGHCDRLPVNVYEHWLLSIVNEAIRVLKSGGALYVYHLPFWGMKIGAHLQSRLDFRHWIAISMKAGFARGQRLYPAHYSLLYFTKGEPANFLRPKIRTILCRHCSKPIKDYGGYREIIEEKGINLSDVWDDLSPVRHRTTKTWGANELPSALMQRIVTMSGAPGALYVDPFVGSGSGVVAAVAGGMTFAANDKGQETCEALHLRLAKIKEGRRIT